MILLTGGAGFIGSQMVRTLLTRGEQIVVLDLLTYAGSLKNLEEVSRQIRFVKGDIRDAALVRSLLSESRSAGGKSLITGIINFAAESHVDRSISGPEIFVETNIGGTACLLAAALDHFKQLQADEQKNFRFLQVSTDEVFGSLGETGYFSETTPYAPNSPYSASKAGADHLVRAWHHTFGLPTLITNCSNNYGPRQYPEKLIPLMISHALAGKDLPVYGQGTNVRDWIHVEDHCAGIDLVLRKGRPGETYCLGGRAERQNIVIVELLCSILEELRPKSGTGKPAHYRDQIRFVTDRLGHDLRYAIDDSKAEKELGFSRKWSFETGLRETVRWYLERL